MKERIDSLVEVRIHLFKKDEVCDVKVLEDLQWCGWDWESKIVNAPPPEQKENQAGQIITVDDIPDGDRVFFEEDTFAFSVCLIGQHSKQTGMDWMVQEDGWPQVLEGCRDDLRNLFGKNPQDHESIITAWSFWSHGGQSFYDDDYECGVDLLGRVKMESIEVTMEPLVDPTLCTTCGAKPGKARMDAGLSAGVHCDECWTKMVADARKQSW